MALNLVHIKNEQHFCLILPSINYAKFPKYRREKRICPICGKEFEATLRLQSAAPGHKYCSTKCAKIARIKAISGLVDEKLFSEFLNKHKNRIQKVINCTNGHIYRDRSASNEDLYQECLITLFLTLAAAIRDSKNPMQISDGYIFYKMKFGLVMSKAERRRFYSHSEEADTNKELEEKLNNLLSYVPNLDQQIDNKNMLRKIFELAQNDNDVALALEKAYMYKSPKDEQSCKFLKNKYCLDDNKYRYHLNRGVEYIYYNDSENIKSYIDINNLSNTYKFNSKKLRYNESFFKTASKEAILAYYSGIRVCSHCGKKFKANSDQITKENVYCCTECKKEAARVKRNEWRRNKRAEERKRKELSQVKN